MKPLLNNGGKDATKNFESIGHSNSAKKLMKKFEIGSVKGEGKN